MALNGAVSSDQGRMLYDRVSSIDAIAHYLPSTPKRAVAVAHGYPWPDGSKSEEEILAYTWTLVEAWREFAEAHAAVVLIPPLGSSRFADYRTLSEEGRPRPDVYLDHLVEQLARLLRVSAADFRFSLFGHSAGGQFAARYLLLNPKRLTAAVVSAASTYPFPSGNTVWPYGMAGAPPAADWAVACTVPAVVCVGADDRERRPDAPGQAGTTRVQRATDWVEAMRRYAGARMLTPRMSLSLAPGHDHDEVPMSEHGQKRLAELWTTERQ